MTARIVLPFPKALFDARFNLIIENVPLFRDGMPRMVSDETFKHFELEVPETPVREFRAYVALNYGPQDVMTPEAAAKLSWPSANKKIRDGVADGSIELIHVPLEMPKDYPRFGAAVTVRGQKLRAHMHWSESSLNLQSLIERSDGSQLGAFPLRKGSKSSGIPLLGLMGTETRDGSKLSSDLTGVLYVKAGRTRAFLFDLAVADTFHYVYLTVLMGKTFEGFLETNPPDPPRERRSEAQNAPVDEEEASSEEEDSTDDADDGLLKANLLADELKKKGLVPADQPAGTDQPAS